MKKLLLIALTSAVLLPFNAMAGAGHGGSNMGNMNMGTHETKHKKIKRPDRKLKMATGTGIINSISPMGSKINITHKPIEALGWPAMTMDILVADNVDMSSIQVGKEFDFKIKQGSDLMYRITEFMDTGKPQPKIMKNMQMNGMDHSKMDMNNHSNHQH